VHAGRTVTEPTTLAVQVEECPTQGLGYAHAVNGRRAGQSGTQWGTLAADPGNAAVMAPGDGAGAGFRPAQPGREPEKLEI
jgi:hypothetical protein